MDNVKITISLTADEDYITDALREIAEYIDGSDGNEEINGSKLKNKHYVAEINVL